MQSPSLKRNIVMNAMLAVSSIIFPLITFPYVSRILTPVGTGKVSFATSLISYFSLFAQLGIPTYGVRACAKVRDNKEELTRTAHELLIINLIMDCVSYFALFLALRYVDRLQDEKLLYVIISSTVFLTSIGMEWLYRALEQYTYITVRSIVFKFIALIGMFLLIHEKQDYLIYGGLSIFASSASNILNFLNAHKYIGFKPVGKYNIKKHWRPVFVFFSMSCATTIYGNLDTVMLGFIKSDIDVGYYGAAVKVKNTLVGLVTSLGSALLPRASYFVEQGRIEDFNRITEKALHFVCVVSIPLLVYFSIFSKESILILSGSEFAGAIVPMAVITPTLFLIGLSNILGLQILVPLGREKAVLYSEICGTVTNLVANSVLIPLLAATGAAIGTVAAEGAVLMIQCFYLKKDLSRLFGAIQMWNIILCSFVAAMCSSWLKLLSLNNFLTMCISSLIFFGLYVVGMMISRNPIVIEMVEIVRNKIKWF